MNLVNGFLIAVTCRGNVVIVSPTIEQHLGHNQVKLKFFLFFDIFFRRISIILVLLLHHQNHGFFVITL